MRSISDERKKDIVSRNALIEQTKITLRSEFVGIDSVIDQMVDMCRAWYIFPELQLKPTIINLWGMTGVGKTSLVKRFCELINLSNNLIKFDLGNSISEKWNFQNNIESMIEMRNNKPLILMLDEFQHARTLGSMGEELERPAATMMWEIMDSGKFTTIQPHYELYEIEGLITKLIELLSLGVKVENGKITAGLDIFYKVYYKGLVNHDITLGGDTQNQKDWNEDEFDLFVPLSAYDGIVSLTPNEFPTRLSLWEKLKMFNAKETIDFLKELVERTFSPKEIDCSKALIFVLGNLDEAYGVSKNITVDLDADVFHEHSRKIKLPKIKQALLQKFRPEQVARLGNNHIIYLAFSNKNFVDLIQLNLRRLSETMLSNTGLKITFDKSIVNLLYNEGVYPTQGARPLLSTIHNLIDSRLPQILTNIILSTTECDSLLIANEGEKLVVTTYFEKQEGIRLEEKIDLTLGELRCAKRDDMQAIAAVHEASHAIVHCALFRKAPDYIISVTTDGHSGGLVFVKNTKEYYSRSQMINEICVLLAGYAGETLVFGKDNLTSGSNQDFEHATDKASIMIRDLGMGNHVGVYRVRNPQNENYLHKEESISTEIEKLLAEALTCANTILEKNKPLLLRLADHLSDERLMDKSQVEEFIKQHSKLFSGNENQQMEYRKHLKELVSSELQTKKRLSA